MVSLKSLLGQRLKNSEEKEEKMTTLASRSQTGELTGFSGVFQISKTTTEEKNSLEELLERYKKGNHDTEEDLAHLLTITTEVKAINNQAIILHGDRIKRAQKILRNYKDGAFTKWMIEVYGNRQTPYNFLQYYELYSRLDDEIKKIADEMPKQAMYSLASRQADEEAKKRFIMSYKGETKQAILSRLRATFPLHRADNRKSKQANVTQFLARARDTMKSKQYAPSLEEKRYLKKLLAELEDLVKD